MVTPFFVLLALVVLGVVAVVAGGRGGGMGPAGSDRPGPFLPHGDVAADDVDAVHFGVGFRGYRMDEVDAVLDRLADELRLRDSLIEELSAGRRSGSREAPPRGSEGDPTDG